MRAVITVKGDDAVGIIAKVSGLLAKSGVNIIDISQTILEKQFLMVMLVETNEKSVDFASLRDSLVLLGKEINQIINIRHETVYNTMHRI